MGRIGLALRLFFRTIRDQAFAEQAQRLIAGEPPAALPAPAPTPAPPPGAPTRVVPARSDALNLLAVLQREGRLIDFLKEDLSGYSDGQIGAAVRDVHRDASSALERIFALRPLRHEPEGTVLDVPPGFDASSIRLTGQVSASPPYRGYLRHAGWAATKCELPDWSGSPESARTIAPAEIEIS